MKFKIIEIPSFKAVSSGCDTAFDFTKKGKLGKFNAFFSEIRPTQKESFMKRDFLYYDQKDKGLVWIYAVTDNLDTKDFEIFDFDGGLYLSYYYIDGEQEENERLYNEALEYIEHSDLFELDIRSNHYPMGHIVTPHNLISQLGFAQMESFIPIKIKSE